MPKLRTVIPKKGTPTADYFPHGRKVETHGTTYWEKGMSPTPGRDSRSPYIERAAYEVDKMLGFNFVPTTIIRVRNGKVVSMQRWIEATNDWSVLSKLKKTSTYRLLGLLDYIINNTDRHDSNIVVDKKHKMWAIDNAYSFYFERGREIYQCEDEIFDNLTIEQKAIVTNKLQILLANKMQIRKKLRTLIDSKEVTALIRRMNNVLKSCQCQ